VNVTAGATTSGIDFQLALGGTITGTVTDAGTGAPLANLHVQAYSWDGSPAGSTAATNGLGVYMVTGLATGTHYVRTSNSFPYLDELYNDLPCPGGSCTVTAGTGVSVAAGTTTYGIDFGLTPGGSIAGTVTAAATGAPLANVAIEVFAATGSWVARVTTNASGDYAVTGLATDTCYVRTSNGFPYLDELYNDVPCAGGNCPVTAGTGVSVTAGATAANINFALTLGGTITGGVTDAGSGAPLANVHVQAYDASGSSAGSGVTTNASGVYVVTGLPTGTYCVRTTDSRPYVDELYYDLPCPGGNCTVTAGTGVSVTAGATTADIDFALALGGKLAGTVTDAATGAPIADVGVQVYAASGTWAGGGTTDALGVYTVADLATSAYHVRTTDSFPYLDELYNDLPCAGGNCTVTAGTAVSVTVGATNIDFRLAMGGTITGTVTAAGTGAPLANLQVQVYDASGGPAGGGVATNASGVYVVTGLAPGTYYVRTSNAFPYLDELYEDLPCPGGSCPPVTTGTAIIVTAGVITSGIDFGLAGVGAGDLNGDRKSDILWRHSTQGDIWLWAMDGAVRVSETYVRTVADTDWEIRGLGDQTGDSKADMLWRNKTTGQIYLWPMDGGTPLNEIYVTTVDPAYDIVGTGDFDGDGKADILWRHLAGGDLWIWRMDGATPLSQTYVDTVDLAYVVKGVADLNANGKADIVFHHQTLGEVWVWPMNGATRLSQDWVGTVPDTGCQIVGVADYTGDGKADLLWHHATLGEVWIWTMNGPVRMAETWVGTVPDTGYQIAGSGDYDGDGMAGILWHHATLGEAWVWLMDGTTKLSETWVATVPDVGYQIVKGK